MTAFSAWLPYGVLGLVLVILLVVLRFPEREAQESERPSPIGIGAVRVAAVIRTGDAVVVDGLVDRLSALGSAGSPITILLAPAGTDEASYRRLADWAETDAVVEIALEAGDPRPRVVGLRSGGAELHLPIVALSS